MTLLGFFGAGMPEWAKVPGFSDGETGLVRDLLQKRDNARREKNFALADKIRDGLKVAGVVVRDTIGEPEFEKAPNFNVNALDEVWGNT